MRPIQGARILLAEDNEINQQVASELLRQARFLVDIAGNGQEALEKLVPGRYDCVLMDVQMPVMDGLEAARRIRADGRFNDLPILAMTANAMVEDRRRTFEAGMNGHIVKPINHDELFGLLLTWIPAANRDLSTLEETPASSAETPALMPEMPGIETAEGLARMAGNVRAYRRLLLKFVENQAGTVTEIRKAAAQGDGALARRLAHTLKGVAGTIGATTLAQAARDLETALLKDGADPLDGPLSKAGDELERIVSVIRAAASPDGPATAGPETTGDLMARLGRLRETLAHYDVEAEDLLSDLLGRLTDPTLAAALKHMHDHVARYEFDGALELLDALLESLSATPAGSA